MRIKAINSDQAGAIDDDELGLVNVQFMCLGSRMMITQNLYVAHGLVNGTIGVVEDIIVDADGVPTSILVRVRRRTHDRVTATVGRASVAAFRIPTKLSLPYTGVRKRSFWRSHARVDRSVVAMRR